MIIKERCDVCKGERKVVGMGAMKIKCANCSGTGFVEVKDDKKSKSRG